jgi:hypothetical protein
VGSWRADGGWPVVFGMVMRSAKQPPADGGNLVARHRVP